MTLDNFLQFVKNYLLPFMGLPFLGVVVGAWLTNSFFPFRLKRREWRWEKELWAKELFFETVSRIRFIADHYLKGEYEERFSMSGLGHHEADEEIMRLVKELHSVGHRFKLYLTKSDSKLFEEYLRDSQTEFDAAKESWERGIKTMRSRQCNTRKIPSPSKDKWLQKSWRGSSYLHNQCRSCDADYFASSAIFHGRYAASVTSR